MDTQPKVVTIIGGSGFVGRYVAQKMARRGWRVRVACRRPNEAMFVKPYGVVGQVEPVQCNIRNEASLKRVIDGADAVINCVGLLWQTGSNTFDACQADGAAAVARIARDAGVEPIVHVSAIGADRDSDSAYARTKAEGEDAVLSACPEAIILRPSIIFGNEDGFFNQFARLSRLTPVLPLVGAETRFQPVWVEDVAEAAARGACGEVAAGVYELGGPRVVTFRACMELMLKIIRRRRLVVNVPFVIAGVQGAIFGLTSLIGVQPLLTSDQVRLLRRDNVASDGALGFAEIGIEPTAMEAILETYLYAYRPYGQYTALAESGGPES